MLDYWGLFLAGMFVISDDVSPTRVLMPRCRSVSALAQDIKNVLKRLLLAPAVVIMALYRITGFPLNNPTFRELIFREGEAKAPFRLFCIASLMTSKWLEDDSYTNRTW